MLPFYLKNRLINLGVTSVAELKEHCYLQVFQWLKDTESSLSRKTLFDLYCLTKDLPLNSLSLSEQHAILAKYKYLLPRHTPLTGETITKFMTEAMGLAEKAQIKDEVPIGAIVVKDSQVIGSGYNKTLSSGNITLHAEVVAITMAAKTIGSHRLVDCDLYVTIEPCLMCMGAIIHSRIKRVIFGALEPKTGAIVSQYQVLNNINTNKYTEGIGPIDNVYYSHQMQGFMRARR